MALYHTVSFLMVAVLLQSNIRQIIAATVPTQPHHGVGKLDDVLKSAHATFINDNFDVADKNDQIGNVADIMDALQETLQTVSSMDGEIQINSSDETTAVSSHVNHPDQLAINTLLQKLYKTLGLNNDIHSGYESTITRFELNKTNSEYKISRNGSNLDYHSSSATVTAHFNRLNKTVAVSNQSHPIVEVQNGVCTTLACNESATQILNNMDENVDPCDNFYKFACGGFINKTSIPDDQSKIGAFITLRDRIKEQLKSILEEPSAPDELRYIKVTKNYYKSCMNEDAIEKRGLAPLQEILKDLGGWPVVEGRKWNGTNFDWLESSYRFDTVGLSSGFFISLYIGQDSKNSTHKMLTFDEPSLGLSREKLIEGMNSTKVQAYYQLMVDIAVILGATRDDATAELEESLKFEIELAKIMLPKSERRNMTRFYNPMTLNELSQKFPSIAWKKYINEILAPHFTVDDNEIVIVTVPEFIPKFINLMKVTPKRVQANYAMWRLTGSVAEYLNNNITTRLSIYEREVTGNVKSQSRWKKCVDKVSYFFTVRSMYVKKFFSGTAKNKTIQMVSDIMVQLKETLRIIDWMDNETRKNALEKADAISSYIAYPDQLLNDTLMEKTLENADFHDNTYFENHLIVQRSDNNDTYSRFREPYNSTDWDQHAIPAIVNAFYNLMGNSIDFPAGILQGVFFNEERPRYMNYGAIGTVIGHEITHAFDDQGRQFDKRGNVRDWWTSSTDEKYHRKAKCVIDQYSNYTVEEIGKKVDGFNTQGENIADIGGIKIAYLAYQNWMKKHGQEATLPGLNYNPQQMFWLSTANVRCSKSHKKTLENRIIDGSHSPDEFRILGPLRDLPEFAADFNCPVGSNMNPKDRCTFW